MERHICTWYYVCVVTPHGTNDNVTTKTLKTLNTAHMNTDTWAQFSWFVSSLIHIALRGSKVLRMSSTHVMSVSPRPWSPSSSTSLTSHSSWISCTSSRTSSTTLRAVVTLRTSPEWRWTPLTTPASSHKTDYELHNGYHHHPKQQSADIYLLFRTRVWQTWRLLEMYFATVFGSWRVGSYPGTCWSRQILHRYILFTTQCSNPGMLSMSNCNFEICMNVSLILSTIVLERCPHPFQIH